MRRGAGLEDFQGEVWCEGEGNPYGEIPKQSKPMKNNQNQGNIMKSKNTLRTKTGPLKTIKAI